MSFFATPVSRLLLVLALPILLSFSPGHKFYISTTTIAHNAKEKSLEITVKSFTHDFEAAIEHGTEDRLFLGSQREHAEADEKIKAYLEKHLHLKVNGKVLPLNYIGKEIEIHDCFLYLEVTGIEAIESMEVENTLLLSLFEKQVNEIKFSYAGQHQQLSLNRNRTKGVLKSVDH